MYKLAQQFLVLKSVIHKIIRKVREFFYVNWQKWFSV